MKTRPSRWTGPARSPGSPELAITAPGRLQAEVELRGRIQQICLYHRIYGTRRVTKLLRIQGLPVCRKRVQRLMRLDNLLALRKRRWVLTTDSRHTYAVYRNLAASFEPCAANQMWVADITYIRLRESFA
ncbi:MAG: IS3 family transposase [Acidobacteriota bacterium]